MNQDTTNVIKIKCPHCREEFKIKVNKIKDLEERIKVLENMLSLYNKGNNKNDMPDFFKDLFSK